MSGLTLPQMPRLPSKAKFWKKRSSANISEYDPTFRVIYLGNVLTGWAKGEGCVDKPLATLWKNHMTTDKPNIIMKVTVCASGLKAVTKEHGLTEYWAHRITFCEAEPSYPKVFCWIYRHEGRKMKQELRCHAVLCPSENKARMMAKRLKEKLHQALVDFKKEKVWRQNARLSLANAADEQKTMPFRKIMLQAGSSNYRPPLEKGKSAPKLKVIEEVIYEEDEEDDENLDPCHDNDDDEDLTITAELERPPETASRKDEDTNHITRLRIDGSGSSGGHHLTSSDSLPLLAVASEMTSRCSSSLSMDQLSTMTAVTSFIDDDNDDVSTSSKMNVQNLIVISSDPSPDIRRARPLPIPRRTFQEVEDDADDDADDDEPNGLQGCHDSSDEDKVTDYLEKLSVEVSEEAEEEDDDDDDNRLNSAQATSSSAASTAEVSPRQSESDAPVSPLMASTRLANNEQDTISDESGYSEESNPSNKNEDLLEEDFDLTVKGVLISDFSPSERLKYLQRSQSTSSRNRSHQPGNKLDLTSKEVVPQQQQPQPPGSPAAEFFQNKVPEFCINI